MLPDHEINAILDARVVRARAHVSTLPSREQRHEYLLGLPLTEDRRRGLLVEFGFPVRE